MVALEKWKETYKGSFHEWIDAVGNIESLNSLASLAFNNPGFITPTPVRSQELQIAAANLAHPLIPAAERVANDCTIGKAQRLILVTGSNMSGKTTFLRTMGVNLLLAQCGAPVCATDFSFTPMQLLTSLRVSDSLQEHTSYFMAELKKLQRIIHHLREGIPSLVLIDEILRGTNSEDKTYGSEQFIRKLLQYPCLSFFASHDLSLGSLEKEMPGLVSNYCFESVIQGDELHFDYRLRQGIARNRNASFLMKKMDII
jgi:DNA mismatch repair ATPase MutS